MSQLSLRHPNARIIVFAKSPVPGYAKTRLIPVLGAQGAADLQARLIRRTVDLAVGSALAPVSLWVCGATGREFFATFQHAVGGRILLQTGSDLGARMGYALEHALQDAEFAVLIGSDCPVLDVTHLEHACAVLAAGADLTLGPAEDGGYVLIGLRRFDPLLFDAIAWGSSTVLEQTRERSRRLGWTCGELPLLWDVDRPEDLERLSRLPADGRHTS